MKLQRLDKIISNNTQYSRSEVAKLIKQELVTVNGVIASSPSEKYDLKSYICVKDEVISTVNDLNVVLFYKPEGYVCANEDSQNPTIFSLLPDRFAQMHSVGRLDIDATGLLFLTTDGKLSHILTSPKHHTPKTYRVTLADPVEDFYAIELEQGIQLNGEKNLTLPAKLEVIDDYTVDLTITEGRYHQVKRMFAALGNKVVALHRWRIGNCELPSNLEPGEYIELSSQDVLDFIN